MQDESVVVFKISTYASHICILLNKGSSTDVLLRVLEFFRLDITQNVYG